MDVVSPATVFSFFALSILPRKYHRELRTATKSANICLFYTSIDLRYPQSVEFYGSRPFRLLGQQEPKALAHRPRVGCEHYASSLTLTADSPLKPLSWEGRMVQHLRGLRLAKTAENLASPIFGPL